MLERPPFTFTPNIVRYLKEVIDMYEMHVQGVPGGIPFTPFSHVTDTYRRPETFYSFSEANRHSFVEYVGRNDAILIQDADAGDPQQPYEDKWEYRTLELHDPEMAKGFGHHPWEILIEVNDIRPALALWKIYLRDKGKPITQEDVAIERLRFNDRRLTYFDNLHTFQKGKNAKAKTLKVFEQLWQERQHSVNGQMIQLGKPQTLEIIGKRLGTVPMMRDFYNLEKSLKDDGMPIQIKIDGDSVHLIVNESF